MHRRLAALSIASVIAFACATSKPGDDPFNTDRIRPDDHAEIQVRPAPGPSVAPPATAPAASTPGGASRKAIDPAALSKVFTLEECKTEVGRLAKFDGNEASGWALLKACIAHGKYNDLNALLSPPWLSRLRDEGSSVAVRLVSEVIASRGANFIRDLPACQEKEIPIYELGAALDNPKTFKGRFLLVRGIVTHQENDDRHLNVEIDETSMQVKDRMQRVSESGQDSEGEDTVWRRGYRYRRRRENFAAPTGRTLTGVLAAPNPALLTDVEYVLLVKFGSRQPPEDELDDREHALVDIVNFYKPGVDMPAVLE